MHPGDVLGRRFELEQRVGSGGMGEVFRARDRASGEVVAVKVLLAGQGLDRRRFQREAELLQILSHPGIVRYVAHGEVPSGEPYLAMFVRLAHAEVLQAAGHPERACAAIAVARDRLLANAAKIEDPTYRASFLAVVPENARTLALAVAWLGEDVAHGGQVRERA